MNPEEEKNKSNEGQQLPTDTTPDIQEIIKKGNEIYNTLKEELEQNHNGEYVVIEIDSGRNFIGETRDEATLEAKKEFPDKIMFIKRIGQEEKISRHFPCSRHNYERVF
ncbi:MAG: hypothetical protein WC511_07490 [Candidatus Pacearchaeota archaeon]|jgi:hypothetical protein